MNRKFAGSQRVDLIKKDLMVQSVMIWKSEFYEFIAEYVIRNVALKCEFEFEKVQVGSSA